MKTQPQRGCSLAEIAYPEPSAGVNIQFMPRYSRTARSQCSLSYTHPIILVPLHHDSKLRGYGGFEISVPDFR